MDEGMWGVSLEGWRLRRRLGHGRARPVRAVVVGEGAMALDCARHLAASRTAQVTVSAQTAAGVAEAVEALVDGGGRAIARVTHLLEGGAPCDVVVLFSDQPSRTDDLALWAARVCPLTVLVIASWRGLALSRRAHRTSGLTPYLILSPGGMPRAAIESARLARRLEVSAAQVEVPVIGGDGSHLSGGPAAGAPDAMGTARSEPAATRPLRRYASVSGIPAREIDEKAWKRWTEEPEPSLTDAALLSATVRLTRAVIEDRREVLDCGAWIEGAHGLAGGFVAAPVRVGARGAEEPLPLRLTLEERAFLQRAASDSPRVPY